MRQGIIDVRGAVGETDVWTPHMSIAYSDTDGPAKPYRDALASVTADPVTVTIQRIQLIALGRDEHLYRWESVADLPLGTQSLYPPRRMHGR
ncbi:hypothetical protein Pth03_12130 [Planotetraspora thailandica]|uniref:2'-5' RNA ligase family protein n=1 Tax=Planotetraspora thailandica TaxID=487172 RepID=A0A8J3UVL3_9ACTN|nr:hypothetical protein Pth03_12130 [Planotetraspora thailandica]